MRKPKRGLEVPAQGDLFGPVVPLASFDGGTIDPAQDEARLTAQLQAVQAVMADGRWRTLRCIARRVNAPEASVSARLRDLRKERFGSWDVERRRVTRGQGLYEYRVKARPSPVTSTTAEP